MTQNIPIAMKKLLFTLTAVLLVAVAPLWAQQEAQHTQFFYYKLGYNPAYAGSSDAPVLTALYRKQWIGLEGAPEVQVLSFNMPLLNQRIGIGGNLSRYTIGITEMYTAEAVYSYRIELGHGMLGLGLSGSVRSVSQDFTKVHGTQPNEIDASIPEGYQQKYLLNFGAGLYYSTEHFYLGVSTPRFLKNNIDFADLSQDQVISREVTHLYLMMGVLLDVGDYTQFQPQILVKYVENAPVDADINFSLIFNERVMTGVTYRLGGASTTALGESLDLILGMQLNDYLYFGLAYDLTFSDIRDYSSGSAEGVVRLSFGESRHTDDVVNPRFF